MKGVSRSPRLGLDEATDFPQCLGRQKIGFGGEYLGWNYKLCGCEETPLLLPQHGQ